MFYAVEKACESALAALAAGDRSALATLYERMGRSVFSVAYAVTGNYHDAEDVLQETMPDAFRCASAYRQGTSACAWLLSIARHKAVDCLRPGVRPPRRAAGRRSRPPSRVMPPSRRWSCCGFSTRANARSSSCACTRRCRIKNLQRCWESLSLRRRSVTSAR